MRAVRAAIPAEVALMADYNQALNRNTARDRCRQLDDEGVYWLEEPVRRDDYAASAELAALLRTPVQIGENFAGPRAMSAALASGPVTSSCRTWTASAVSAAGPPRRRWRTRPGSRRRPICILRSASISWPPRQRLTGSEYVDWADPVLQRSLGVTDGRVVPPGRPGTGLAWDVGAVRRFRRG